VTGEGIGFVGGVWTGGGVVVADGVLTPDGRPVLSDDGGLVEVLGTSGLLVAPVLAVLFVFELGADLELKKLRIHCKNSLNDIPYLHVIGY